MRWFAFALAVAACDQSPDMQPPQICVDATSEKTCSVSVSCGDARPGVRCLVTNRRETMARACWAVARSCGGGQDLRASTCIDVGANASADRLLELAGLGACS